MTREALAFYGIKIVPIAVFMVHYFASLPEAFGNASKSFDNHSVNYVIPAYDFRQEILLGILEGAGNNNIRIETQQYFNNNRHRYRFSIAQ